MWRRCNIILPTHILENSLLKAPTSLLQQFRTTFILKRRWPPGLYKKNGQPHRLRGRNYVYDLVEDTSVKLKQNLEVILTTYVEGLGRRGDIVSVRPLVGYNKLLLPKLAVYKTEENIEKYISTQAPQEEEEEHSSKYAMKTINFLRNTFLHVTMNKEIPWTIEPWHIRACFRKAGCHVPLDAIQLPPKPISGPDLSLEGKEFYITVTINNLEKTPVRCRIRHWSTEPSNKLPYDFEFWKKRAEPVFPEDIEVLNSLPSQAVDEKPPAEVY